MRIRSVAEVPLQGSAPSRLTQTSDSLAIGLMGIRTTSEGEEVKESRLLAAEEPREEPGQSGERDEATDRSNQKRYDLQRAFGFVHRPGDR